MLRDCDWLQAKDSTEHKYGDTAFLHCSVVDTNDLSDDIQDSTGGRHQLLPMHLHSISSRELQGPIR